MVDKGVNILWSMQSEDHYFSINSKHSLSKLLKLQQQIVSDKKFMTKYYLEYYESSDTHVLLGDHLLTTN